jgi:hypothetical protein
VFELLDAAEAGRLRVEADEPGCWTVFVDDAEAFFGVDEAQADAAGASGSPGLPADADGWRDLVAEHGRKVAETLKAVQGLADELGVSDPPRSIGALADADERLQRAVVDWVRGVS